MTSIGDIGPETQSGSDAPAAEKLRQTIQSYWGYDSFLPLQQEAMDAVLEGRDSVVVLPTGGGKSLCFQAPALCMDGLAVVVSPLISLMKDQVDALTACGVPAACVNSSLSHEERGRVADEIRSGRLKLLYVAPERLVQARTIDFLKTANVSLVAIDEAHCISEWGHDFRPEYRQLRMLRDTFPGVGIHCYTATATQRVRDDVARQLGLNDPQVLVGSFDRPNLIYKVERRADRLNQIRDVLDRHPGESGIIYCISRKEVDGVSEALSLLGYRALPYHAGMPGADRKQNQEAFIDEKTDIIVATVAFGMGIDKSNVRYVIHAGMPKSLENYQQESGRAGRDGLDAECCLFYSGGDVVLWRRMLDDSDAAAHAAALQTLQAISDFCTGVVCRHRAIVNYFGQDFEGEACNACDVCLGEVDLVEEPLIVGQKILSSVVRQEQRFGGGYTALVLKGSKDKRILENRHDQLSTWGLLAEEDRKSIRDWIEQLAGQGFLKKEGEYNVLKVTENGRRLLRGEVVPRLLKPAAPAGKGASKPGVEGESWEGVDRDLFETLRTLRTETATGLEVPPYMVFGDASLRDMARTRPSTLDRFRKINGVGDKKLADFGEPFVDLIVQHCTEHSLTTDVDPPPPSARPQTANRPGPSVSAIRAFPHFQKCLSVEEVAAAMDRAASTVFGYLTDYIRHEKVCDPSPWVDEQTVSHIQQGIEQAGMDRLKPIFEFVEGNATYNEIRIVVECMRNMNEADDGASN